MYWKITWDYKRLHGTTTDLMGLHDITQDYRVYKGLHRLHGILQDYKGLHKITWDNMAECTLGYKSG